MIFRDYDPFIAFFHMGLGELPWTGYLVMFIVLIGSLFVMRFWCSYFCPLGVIVGLIGKLGIFKIECDNEKCVSCGKCEKLCPMDVKIAKMGRIKTVECNSCLDCLEASHIKDAIGLRTAQNGKRLTPAFYPIILLVIFFGVIYSSKSLGIWIPGKGPGRGYGQGFRSSHILQNTQAKGPIDTLIHESDSLKVRSGLRKAVEAEETAEAEERIIKIGDKEIILRGNLSFSQIEKLTGVPSSYLISKLKLPPNASRSINLGNLRKRYGFMMQDVRKYIREYLEKYKK